MPNYLFGSGGQPRIEDVDQGQQVGDCWLLASIGAIVRTAQGRQLIQRHTRHLVGPVYEIELWSHPDLTGRAQGWERYWINASRLHGGGTPRPLHISGGRDNGVVIESCDWYELDVVGDGDHRNAQGALTGRQTPLRADGTPNGSTDPILWVILYETAMMHHLGLPSYQAMGQLAVHGTRFGPNAVPLAMRTVMGPGTQDVLQQMFDQRIARNESPSTFIAFFNQSNIPDVWTFVVDALGHRAARRDTAVTADTPNFLSHYRFWDRDIHGREVGVGSSVVHLSSSHVYSVIGHCASDPEEALIPSVAAGNLCFVRVRNPWGTDDQYYSEEQIRHAIPMGQFVRLFTGIQVYTIPAASSDGGLSRRVQVAQHGRPEPSREAGVSSRASAATREPPDRGGGSEHA